MQGKCSEVRSQQGSSREAAQDYSPRRKPWVEVKMSQPRRGERAGAAMTSGRVALGPLPLRTGSASQVPFSFSFCWTKCPRDHPASAQNSTNSHSPPGSHLQAHYFAAEAEAR